MRGPCFWEQGMIGLFYKFREGRGLESAPLVGSCIPGTINVRGEGMCTITALSHQLIVPRGVAKAGPELFLLLTGLLTSVLALIFLPFGGPFHVQLKVGHAVDYLLPEVGGFTHFHGLGDGSF